MRIQSKHIKIKVLLWVGSGLFFAGLSSLFMDRAFVPVSHSLSIHQAIQLTKILKSKNIEYRLKHSGRELLVRKNRLSDVRNIKAIEGWVEDHLQKRVMSLVEKGYFKASNEKTLASINHISTLSDHPSKIVSDYLRQKLQNEFGAGVTQVNVYAIDEKDLWKQSSRKEAMISHMSQELIIAVHVDSHWIEGKIKRSGLSKNKLNSNANNSYSVEIEQIQQQLLVESHIRSLVQHHMKTQFHRSHIQVMVGIKALQSSKSKAEFTILKSAFPIGSLFLIFFMFSFLMFQTGVTYLKLSCHRFDSKPIS
jgi:hypothetical protein